MVDLNTLSQNDHLTYLLRIGDTSLILGHRLSEWCGHGPILEEDIALSNIALDLIGQARLLYTHAGTLEGKGRDEDDIAFLRDAPDWRNVLMVEQPNGDFAMTIARQFLIDCFHVELFQALSESNDPELSAIATKSLKEVTYHRRHSGEWVIRLGDGTEESHQRIQKAFNHLWIFTDELFETDDVDEEAARSGVGIRPTDLRTAWDRMVDSVFAEATLDRPKSDFPRSGGRNGAHSEHLGFLLAEMQFLQRAYPGQEW